MDATAFPPELLDPLPRRVQRRPGGSNSPWYLLILIPHSLIACGLLGWAIYSAGGVAVVAQFGELTQGWVTDLQEYRSQKHGMVYTVHFRYRVGADSYDSSDTVAAAAFSRLSKGNVIQVRMLSAAPAWKPCPVLPDYSPWTSVAPLSLFAVFWSVLTSLIVATMILPLLRAKQLVRSGLPTSGVVTDKQTKSGKTTTYLIHYQFIPERAAHDEAASRSRSASTAVPKNDYLAAQRGDIVTVLYDPVRPDRSLIYEFADYRAVGPGA